MKIKKNIFFILYFLFFSFCFSENAGDKNFTESSESGSAVSESKIENSEKKDGLNDDGASEDKKDKRNKKASEDFYSLQNSGLTACYGERWFFEQFDENGNAIISVLYEKDKLIEKRSYTYNDGYKTAAEIVLSDKIIKIKYNKKGFELENEVYTPESELTEKTVNVYNGKDLLVKTVFIKDETERSSEFSYNINGKRISQTDFLDGKKLSFIEYKNDKKIIHLFEDGKEIKILEESI